MTNPVTKGKAREFFVAETLKGELHIFRENHEGGGLTKFIEWSAYNDLKNKYRQLDMVFGDQTEELRACVLEFDDGRYLGRKLSSAIVEEYRAIKAQNEKLRSCVEFYATRSNWHEGDNKDIYLDNCIDISDCEELDGVREGGKLARQVLKELGENK